MIVAPGLRRTWLALIVLAPLCGTALARTASSSEALNFASSRPETLPGAKWAELVRLDGYISAHRAADERLIAVPPFAYMALASSSAVRHPASHTKTAASVRTMRRFR